MNLVVSLDPTSWVLRGKKSPGLLSHEQTHYLVVVLLGRELEQKLLALTAADAGAFQMAASALIQQQTDRADEIGKSYDEDTAHGRNAGPQKQWETRVADWERQGKVDGP